jgi:large subunit ribosomal protein L22
MDIIAKQKYLITSPSKLREVAFAAKKLTPTKAVEVLPFIGKRASTPLAKVIKSAIANAKAKGVSETDLIFKEIQINEGPRLKRFRAGAHGRAKPYKKRMSHIRVVLTTLSVQIPSSKSQINSNTQNIKTNNIEKEKNVKNNK